MPSGHFFCFSKNMKENYAKAWVLLNKNFSSFFEEVYV